jgi:hypothetical protein
MVMNLANHLFDAEMYAAELLVMRQQRVTDKRSPGLISGRNQLLIKSGNNRHRPVPALIGRQGRHV